jgi:hypothetical protein
LDICAPIPGLNFAGYYATDDDPRLQSMSIAGAEEIAADLPILVRAGNLAGDREHQVDMKPTRRSSV